MYKTLLSDFLIWDKGVNAGVKRTEQPLPASTRKGLIFIHIFLTKLKSTQLWTFQC